MKKLSVLAIAFTVIGLASCKKAYTCECVTTYTSGETLTSTREISKTSKKNAEAICGSGKDVYADTYSSGSPSNQPYTETYNVNCILK
jgi:hypothetical protein